MSLKINSLMPTVFIILLILLVGCFNFENNKKNDANKEINILDEKSNLNKNSKMQIKTNAFENYEFIPKKYTCQGENINPQLIFLNVPQDTKELVLVMDDPDAPSKRWVHWIVFGIEPTTRKIDSGQIPKNAKVAKNDFGRYSYDGPCPPFGTHRYFFKLYALNKKLQLNENATLEEIEKEIEPFVIENATLVGKFSK